MLKLSVIIGFTFSMFTNIAFTEIYLESDVKSSIISTEHSAPLPKEDKPSLLVQITLGTTNSFDTPLYQKANNVLSVAFKELGYRLVIKTLPNKRSLSWANQGVIDGDLFRVSELDLDILPNLQKVSEALFTIDQSVLSKKDIKIEGWKSMKNFSIAYERGTKFIENKETMFKHAFLVNNTEQALAMVYTERADLTITSLSTATKFLEKNKKYADVIRVLEPPLVTITLHAYINKNKHPDLANLLALQLKEMKKTGEFQRLLLNKLNE